MVLSDERKKQVFDWLAYRLTAIDIFKTAYNLRRDYDRPASMEILVEGRLRVDGNINAFCNPAIDAGIIHARALLEFLGLNVADGILAQANRWNNDVGIEMFSGTSGQLQKLTPDMAVSRFKGNKDDARRALVLVITLATKHLVHHTASVQQGYEDDLILIAIEGIPALFNNYFYVPQGLSLPMTHVTQYAAGAGVGGPSGPTP